MQIPLDQSNATFDSTINSTFDNTVNHTLDNSEFGLNSTKAEDSQLEDDIDDGDAEPEPEPEAEAETESIGREEIPDIKQDVEDVRIVQLLHQVAIIHTIKIDISINVGETGRRHRSIHCRTGNR